MSTITIDAKTEQAQELISKILKAPPRPASPPASNLSAWFWCTSAEPQSPDIPVLFLETGYHFPETIDISRQNGRANGISTYSTS